MKIFPDKEVMNKKEPKKIILFVILAFSFAIIATVRKFDIDDVVKIIVYSIPFSAAFAIAYSKLDSMLKIDERIKKLSFGAVFIALLVIPRLIFNNVELFVKYVIFWIAVELLSLGFLIRQRNL